MRKRTEELKKLDAAMKAHAALCLLDTLAEMLAQIPAVDAKLAKNVARWNKQLLAERNRMLPLSDAADRLVHNVEVSRGAEDAPRSAAVDTSARP